MPHQHGELVAAEARYRIGSTHVALHRRDHRLEQRVTGGVAVRVVDRLEAVEVDEHQRRGGDEFAVLMWHLDETLALAKARELETIIRVTTIAHDTAALSVGASAGAVVLPREGTAEAVLEAADRAMYARKREKR